MLKGFIPSGEFSKNVLTLFSGTLLAQSIPVLVSPLLTRLFTPAEFGLLALFTSIVFSLATFATGRYELAIMLPQKDEDSGSIAGVAFFIGLIFSVILLLPIIFFNHEIASLFGSPEISRWLLIVPLAVFLTAFYQICNYWLLRKKRFRASAINKVSQTSVTAVSGLISGHFSVSGGLVFADVFGRISGALISAFQVMKSGFSFSWISINKMKANAKKYKDYPLYNAAPAFLDTFTLQLPTIIVNMFYGSSITGFFNFSRQISGNSLLIISSSVSQVFFEKVVSKKNAGEKIVPFIKQLLVRLSLVSIFYSALIFFLAPFVFGLIFGNEWKVAGDFASIMCFGFAVKFIVTPLSVIFPALDKIKKASWWQIIYFCAMATLFACGELSVINFLIVFTVIEVLVYLIYLYLILREAHLFDKKIIEKTD